MSEGGAHWASAVQAAQWPATQARPPVHCALEVHADRVPVVPLVLPAAAPEVVVELLVPEVNPLVAPAEVELDVELVEVVEVVAWPVVPDVETVPVVVRCPVVAVLPVEDRPEVEEVPVPTAVPVVPMLPEVPVVVESTQLPLMQVALGSAQSLLVLQA